MGREGKEREGVRRKRRHVDNIGWKPHQRKLGKGGTFSGAFWRIPYGFVVRRILIFFLVLGYCCFVSTQAYITALASQGEESEANSIKPSFLTHCFYHPPHKHYDFPAYKPHTPLLTDPTALPGRASATPAQRNAILLPGPILHAW